MKVEIIKHARGGFSAKREDGKIAGSSFDVQNLIDQAKANGDTPVINVDTRKYLDQYFVPYKL
jgi:hypothetical protein